MRFLTPIALAVLLASCNGQDQQAKTGQTTPSPAESPPPATESPGLQPWHAVLPGGLVLESPAHLRTDRIYEIDSGAVRRRLTFELLEAGPQAAEEAVTASFENAGYTAGSSEPGDRGRHTIRYRKKGAPSVTVTFYPELGSNAANPDSKSMVVLTWQIKRAPTP